MTYWLVYSHRAIKDIAALDAAVKQRIGKTLQRFEHNPLSHTGPLKYSDLESYRFRIGDYRVVFNLKSWTYY